jgi:hypothetical protein
MTKKRGRPDLGPEKLSNFTVKLPKQTIIELSDRYGRKRSAEVRKAIDKHLNKRG